MTIDGPNEDFFRCFPGCLLIARGRNNLILGKPREHVQISRRIDTTLLSPTTQTQPWFFVRFLFEFIRIFLEAI